MFEQFFRHRNRRAPARRIRRREHPHDDDTFSFYYLTRSQAERLYELCCHERKLFRLTYDLEQFLGLDKDDPSGPVLDHDAWDAYEREERITA